MTAALITFGALCGWFGCVLFACAVCTREKDAKQ